MFSNMIYNFCRLHVNSLHYGNEFEYKGQSAKAIQVSGGWVTSVYSTDGLMSNIQFLRKSLSGLNTTEQYFE